MNRLYVRNPESHSEIRQVELRETYDGSCHYRVIITPEGYGSDPAPMEIGRKGDGCLIQEEGYGIFRLEHAHWIAASLTAAEYYTEFGKLGKEEIVRIKTA